MSSPRRFMRSLRRTPFLHQTGLAAIWLFALSLSALCRPWPAAASTEGSLGGGLLPGLISSPPGGASWLWHGGALLISVPILFWVLRRPRPVNNIRMPGFEIITTSERRSFIPLVEKFHQLDFVAGVKTLGSLRLSANLNKVTLSHRRFGYLLEDKNFRNALLVNRRRVRRTLLKDGDVLDLGDLTLLYRDLRQVETVRHPAQMRTDGKAKIKFERARGPVSKGTPMLLSEQQPNRTFYITKNMIFLGRSESNDLVIKARNIAYRHAKIERLGGRYKLVVLANSGNTFVNSRRVEQRILKEGDEIALDSQRFKFSFSKVAIRDTHFNSPRQPPSHRESGDENGMEEGINGAHEEQE